jgi:metal-responsive CopG/Arc/MetJ family transcriptional regulator
MGVTRINLGLAQPMLKDLDRLAAKYGFDRTNAIRYCIRVTCDHELQPGSKRTHEPTREEGI